MKKKTKARGRSRYRGDPEKAVTLQRDKGKTRRETKTEKKTAKHKKNLRNNLKKKIEKERRKLEERKRFLVETSKLHRDSLLEITPNNLKIIVSFMQGLKVSSLPFDIIETILIETDKYNKIKKIFESFEFEKKLDVLEKLKNLVKDITFIDGNFVNELIDLEKFTNNIEKFKENLKEFDDAIKESNIEKLKACFNKQENLLNNIMDQISELNGLVEEMLDNAYYTVPVEIFNVIEKFYQNYYGEDYEVNY